MENKDQVLKRQIVIETDGVIINVVKAEVASLIEFKAILENLHDFVVKQIQNVVENSKKGPKVEEKTEKIEEIAKVEEVK